jgi:Tol biopolymer transport system component
MFQWFAIIMAMLLSATTCPNGTALYAVTAEDNNGIQRVHVVDSASGSIYVFTGGRTEPRGTLQTTSQAPVVAITRPASMNADVVVAYPRENQRVQLTRDTIQYSTSIVSPDGTQVAAIDETNDQLVLFEIEPNQRIQQTTLPRSPVSHMVWSPSGDQIALITGLYRREMHLIVYSIPTETFRTLTTAAIIQDMTWTPGGNALLYADGDNSYLLDATSGDVIRRFDSALSPRLHPDGSSIAFIRDETMIIRDLMTDAPDITDPGPVITPPAWSVSGQLAYVVQETARNQLIILTDGVETARYALEPDRSAQMIVWSWDGRLLNLRTTRDSAPQVITLTAEGHVTGTVSLPQMQFPVWIACTPG